MVAVLIILSCILVITFVILIRSHFEKEMLVVTPYTVTSEELPEAFSGMRLLYLSDLHDKFFSEGNETLVKMILSEKPDILLFGGDMMTVKEWSKGSFEALESILQRLPDNLLKIYADGNHELRMKEYPVLYPGWYERFEALLSTYHVVHLQTSSMDITRNDEVIHIYGIDIDKIFYKKGTHKMPEGYVEYKAGKAKEGYNIVLSHMPMYLNDFSKWGASLVLSGHFHGGTIRLPLLGGVMSPQFQFFSKYCKGMLQKDKTTGIISGGLGTHSVNIRFNNKPEMLLITLKKS